VTVVEALRAEAAKWRHNRGDKDHAYASDCGKCGFEQAIKVAEQIEEGEA
jgi:hypothetical protein